MRFEYLGEVLEALFQAGLIKGENVERTYEIFGWHPTDQLLDTMKLIAILDGDDLLDPTLDSRIRVRRAFRVINPIAMLYRAKIEPGPD